MVRAATTAIHGSGADPERQGAGQRQGAWRMASSGSSLERGWGRLRPGSSDQAAGPVVMTRQKATGHAHCRCPSTGFSRISTWSAASRPATRTPTPAVGILGGRLLAVARRFLRDEDLARDAVQDAFLSAFRGIHSFDGDAQLATWLHRIVVERCADEAADAPGASRNSPIEPMLPAFSPKTGPAPDRSRRSPGRRRRRSRCCAARRVRRCGPRSRSCPERYRTVLLLRDIEERFDPRGRRSPRHHRERPEAAPASRQAGARDASTCRHPHGLSPVTSWVLPAHHRDPLIACSSRRRRSRAWPS